MVTYTEYRILPFRVPQAFIFRPDFRSLKLSSICIRVAYILATFLGDALCEQSDVASNHGSFSRIALARDCLLRRARSPVTVLSLRPLGRRRKTTILVVN